MNRENILSYRYIDIKYELHKSLLEYELLRTFTWVKKMNLQIIFFLFICSTIFVTLASSSCSYFFGSCHIRWHHIGWKSIRALDSYMYKSFEINKLVKLLIRSENVIKHGSLLDSNPKITRIDKQHTKLVVFKIFGWRVFVVQCIGQLFTTHLRSHRVTLMQWCSTPVPPNFLRMSWNAYCARFWSWLTLKVCLDSCVMENSLSSFKSVARRIWDPEKWIALLLH
jgi:hypothetical protein